MISPAIAGVSDVISKVELTEYPLEARRIAAYRTVLISTPVPSALAKDERSDITCSALRPTASFAFPACVTTEMSKLT
jgi:hypothetical protein